MTFTRRPLYETIAILPKGRACNQGGLVFGSAVISVPCSLFCTSLHFAESPKKAFAYVKGASLFSNGNLLEHPLYGIIRSELVKG